MGGDRRRGLEHGIDVGPLWRIKLHQTHKSAPREFGCERRRWPHRLRRLGDIWRRDSGLCAAFWCETAHRLGDSADVLGPGAAAPSDYGCPKANRLAGKPRKVARGRGRHQDPPLAADQRPGVGRRRQRQSNLPHSAQDLDRPHRSGRAVDAQSQQVEIGQLVEEATLLLVGMGGPFVGKGHHGDQRQIGDAPHRLHRDRQLVDPEEGLENQQIGTAAGKDRGLFGMGHRDHGPPLGFVEIEHTGQRRHRPRDQDVLPRDFARLARELDRGGVHRLGEIADPGALEAGPRAAEGRGLDELGAGFDIGEVDIEHRLRVLVCGEVEA